MNLTHYLPEEKLKHLIKHYWVMDIEKPFEPKEEVLFPVGAVEVIFHIEKPLLRLQNGHWVAEKKAFIEGLQSGAFCVKPSDHTKTIGITLYPWATGIFFRSSALSFTNCNVQACDIDPTLEDIHEKFAMINHDNEIPNICNSHFSLLLKNAKRHYNSSELELIETFKQIKYSGRVEELKNNWPYSSKLFETRFKELIGMPAGELLKKNRMAKALKMILFNADRSFTDVSHAASYFDQSHFIKDFRNYFQYSPKSFHKQQNLLKKFLA